MGGIVAGFVLDVPVGSSLGMVIPFHDRDWRVSHRPLCHLRVLARGPNPTHTVQPAWLCWLSTHT